MLDIPVDKWRQEATCGSLVKDVDAGGSMKTLYLCIFFGGVVFLFCFGVYDWFRSYNIVRADMRRKDIEKAHKKSEAIN